MLGALCRNSNKGEGAISWFGGLEHFEAYQTNEKALPDHLTFGYIIFPILFIEISSNQFTKNFRWTYLYWFKFLQHAEQDENFNVDWNKYSGLGGSNYILGTKFDMFWEENWKKLFGVTDVLWEPN